MSSGTRGVLGLVVYHIGDILVSRLNTGPVNLNCVVV